jgi:predicted small metal-binding protein
MKHAFAAVLAVALALSFFTTTFAQETAKKEEKKEAKHMLKSVSCAPECGFMVRSHDDKEVAAIVIEHAKKAHGKEMTDQDVMDMAKTEEITMETKKEIKKEVEIEKEKRK